MVNTPAETPSRPSRAAELRPLAEHFDKLPDDAMVPVKVLAAVSNEGVSTIWGKSARGEEGFPKLVRLGPKCTRARVGDIRAYLAGRITA